MVKSHTRPFERKWLNVAAALIVPMGIFFYLRMWRFRLRLYRDMRQIVETNRLMCDRLDEITAENGEGNKTRD